MSTIYYLRKNEAVQELILQNIRRFIKVGQYKTDFIYESAKDTVDILVSNIKNTNSVKAAVAMSAKTRKLLEMLGF